MERGKIINRDFAAQIRDFTGLRWGTITPTDVDGFIDFQNKLFILLELKFGNAKLPYGQKLAIERLCDAINKSSIQCYFLIASHQDTGDIDVANAKVTKVRNDTKWYTFKNPITVKQTIDRILGETIV